LTPFIKILPLSISFNLSKTFAIVDFPEPVAPTIANLSPAFIEKEIFLNYTLPDNKKEIVTYKGKDFDILLIEPSINGEFFSREQIESLKKKIGIKANHWFYIYHYVGKVKPWQRDGVDSGLFFQYAYKSPFFDDIIEANQLDKQELIKKYRLNWL